MSPSRVSAEQPTRRDATAAVPPVGREPRSRAAALALQRTAGNRAVARLLGPRGPAVARMILKIRGSFETSDDEAKLTEGARLLRLKDARGRVVPIPRGDEEAFAAVKDVGASESLYLLAHSDGTQIGDLAPRQLAELLNRHLPENYH